MWQVTLTENTLENLPLTRKSLKRHRIVHLLTELNLYVYAGSIYKEESDLKIGAIKKIKCYRKVSRPFRFKTVNPNNIRGLKIKKEVYNKLEILYDKVRKSEMQNKTIAVGKLRASIDKLESES